MRDKNYDFELTANQIARSTCSFKYAIDISFNVLMIIGESQTEIIIGVISQTHYPGTIALLPSLCSIQNFDIIILSPVIKCIQSAICHLPRGAGFIFKTR